MEVKRGLIPDGWESKTLGDVCGRITTGRLDANAMVADGDYPFFTCASENYWIDKYAFDCEALLVSGNGANVGYVHHYNGKFNAYQRTYVISDFSEDVQFIKLFLDRNLQQRIRTEVNAGNTPYIKMDTLTEMRVVLPSSREEQHAIAAALGDVDALIGGLDKLIAKKRDLKQAAMQQLLTGKQRLPGFQGEWDISCLGNCGEVIMGQSPPGSSYNRTGEGSPLINGPTEFTDRHPIKIQWTTQPARFCKKGDLLICVRGSSTGRTNYANDSYAIGRGVAAIRAKDYNDTEYLSYQVISGVSEILAAATGSTFPSVDGASFRKIVVPLPSPDEQTAIATVFSDMDAELAALEARRDKTRGLKQGMMQELLTGKTRLV